MPSDHECGCSQFGPGPHDADLRHPNPKACEHAEYGLDKERLAMALAAADDFTDLEAWRTPAQIAWASRIAAEYERLRADLDSIVDPSL